MDAYRNLAETLRDSLGAEAQLVTTSEEFVEDKKSSRYPMVTLLCSRGHSITVNSGTLSSKLRRFDHGGQSHICQRCDDEAEYTELVDRLVVQEMTVTMTAEEFYEKPTRRTIRYQCEKEHVWEPTVAELRKKLKKIDGGSVTSLCGQCKGAQYRRIKKRLTALGCQLLNDPNDFTGKISQRTIQYQCEDEGHVSTLKYTPLMKRLVDVEQGKTPCLCGCCSRPRVREGEAIEVLTNLGHRYGGRLRHGDRGIWYCCGTCGAKNNTTISNVLREGRTRYCPRCQNVKHRIAWDILKADFAAAGMELLDQPYTNKDTPLKYVCTCGSINTIRIGDVRRGKACRKCGNVKRMITCLDTYGATNILATEYFRQSCQERWGVDHPMQCAEIFAKSQRNSLKLKEYRKKDGTTCMVQGYEPFMLRRLEEDGVEFVAGDPQNIPLFRYEYKGYHTYYPDIYIPATKTIIEVKCPYTYSIILEQNWAKWDETVKNYPIDIWIIMPKGVIEIYLYRGKVCFSLAGYTHREILTDSHPIVPEEKVREFLRDLQ